MRKPKIQKILEEYFIGGLSPELDEIIQGWIINEMGNSQNKIVFEKLFNEFVSSKEPTPETYRRLKKLHKALKEKNTDKKHIPFYRRFIFKIAAVLIPVLILAATAYLLIDKGNIGLHPQSEITETTVDVPVGTHKQLLLADGTQVTLNEGSIFTYDNSRKCTLEGEAYFDVAKSDTPFVIQTKELKVTVLGTEFNLKAYPTGDSFFLSLYNGVVDIDNDNIHHRLEAGKEFVYNNETQEMNISDINPGIEKPLWTDAVMNFEGRTLKDILRAVETYYSVSIEHDGRLDTIQPYSFRFTGNETIEEVMTVLQTISGDFRYTIKQNKIILETIN